MIDDVDTIHTNICYISCIDEISVFVNYRSLNIFFYFIKLWKIVDLENDELYITKIERKRSERSNVFQLSPLRSPSQNESICYDLILKNCITVRLY